MRIPVNGEMTTIPPLPRRRHLPMRPTFVVDPGGMAHVYFFSRSTMKLSTVFLRAAELVATGEQPYSCDAILKAANGDAPSALLFWRDRFTPSPDSPEHYWLRGEGMTKEERMRWRLVGLCLAAAVARSEGL